MGSSPRKEINICTAFNLSNKTSQITNINKQLTFIYIFFFFFFYLTAKTAYKHYDGLITIADFFHIFFKKNSSQRQKIYNMYKKKEHR